MVKRAVVSSSSLDRGDPGSVALQHIASLLGHTGSPRAVASCQLEGLSGSSCT